ncbi:MAG TPA: hypothetical protein VL404_06020 [Candidatus Eisenbacteria bacterium]|nr:hypothetical protein [Candidatus Eisenbacteria bacterium]
MRKAVMLSLVIGLSVPAAAGAESVHGIVTDTDSDSVKLFRVDTSEPPTTLQLKITPQTRMKGVDGLGGLDRGAEVTVETGGPAGENAEARSLELLAHADETKANLRSAKLNILTGGLAVTAKQDLARDVGLLAVREGKSTVAEASVEHPTGTSDPYPFLGGTGSTGRATLDRPDAEEGISTTKPRPQSVAVPPATTPDLSPSLSGTGSTGRATYPSEGNESAPDGTAVKGTSAAGS